MEATKVAIFELLLGNITAAEKMAERAIGHDEKHHEDFDKLATLAAYAETLFFKGNLQKAQRVFSSIERKLPKVQPGRTLIYSQPGFSYCSLLLAKGHWAAILNRAIRTRKSAEDAGLIRDFKFRTGSADGSAAK